MSYLAYRVEGGAFIEAAETLDWHLAARKRLADKIRELRRLCAWSPLRHSQLLVECATKACGMDEVPFKPTASAFRHRASTMLAYSRTKWRNPYDSEYYSADGYDDFQGEQREAAKWEAIVAFVLWKHLAGIQSLPVASRPRKDYGPRQERETGLFMAD